MKSKVVLAAVAALIFVAGFAIGAERNSNTTSEGKIVGLNHVGIRVPDFEAASDFYENTLGFPLTYRFDDKHGKPIFAYFQINASTFIELLPADKAHPAGIDHFGLEIREMDSVVAQFRSSGISVANPYVSPFTRVNLAHATDPDGVYFELIEAVEGSDLQRVMQSWQDKVRPE